LAIIGIARERVFLDYEWRNLAKDPKFASVKAQLARSLPTSDAPWPDGVRKKKAKRK
jgi:hypothetical protein